jgi:3-phenylpropionate/trans-cinnamate dioxygenase ferredoxin subunit
VARYVAVAKVEEIQPGDHRRVMVEGEAILLANVDGQYYAIADRCTHEEARLSEGFLVGGQIECPLHGSRFDLGTGAAKALPATAPVRTYETKVADGQVYVKLPESQ